MHIRMEIEFTRDTLKNIEKMMKDTSTQEHKELLNAALTMFKWAIEAIRKGHIVASLDAENKTYKTLLMDPLEVVAHKFNNTSYISSNIPPEIYQ